MHRRRAFLPLNDVAIDFMNYAVSQRSGTGRWTRRGSDLILSNRLPGLQL